ncbi:MAG: hypothetical protein K6D54_07945 [Bacteroidales bacterium]|nr:hypothetical protein [Bacteroidales bacterium]
MKDTQLREYLTPDLSVVTVEPASHLAQVVSPLYIPPTEDIQNEGEPGTWGE